MATIRSERDLTGNTAAHGNKPPGTQRRSGIKRGAMWLLVATILGAAGLIGFQLLMTLVTLD